MIKIEPGKTFTLPKSGLSKTSLENSENEAHNGAVVNEPAEGGGEFARVLENLTSKKEPVDHDSLTKPREKDVNSKHNQHDKAEQNLLAKKKPDNKTADRQDAAGAAAARITNNDSSTADAEPSIPPARAIMHIADLERIVSSVRAQTFDGSSQVIITLKNSVCSGLQIKLTTDDNQRVTAEFIAANEKVKAQIDARSGELADLLRQRGLKLASLQSSVGSETSGGDDRRQNSRNSEPQTVSTNSRSSNSSVAENDQISEATETASVYRI